MMKHTLTASAMLLALAACGGGGSDEGAVLVADGPKPAPVAGQPPAAQPPTGRAPSSAPPPTPPSDPPPPAASPAPPVATPPPSDRPVASPTSGSWVVVCRQSHAPGGIVHGVVTTDGMFSVDDGVIDLRGNNENSAPVERDPYNPEVSTQKWRSYGSLTLVIRSGDDTRPRWVGAYDSNSSHVRQWECSTILQTVSPASTQGMCYASKDSLNKGLGPPVVVGVNWQDSRVFIERSDAPSVVYSLGQARDVTMPYEGRASDGTNLRCW